VKHSPFNHTLVTALMRSAPLFTDYETIAVHYPPHVTARLVRLPIFQCGHVFTLCVCVGGGGSDFLH
jgi:hypothetical protein